MSDSAIQRWKPAGHVYLWQFRRDVREYAGWNCMADEDGCQAMIAFFEIMAKARWTSTGNIPLSVPNADMIAVPKGWREDARISPPKLKIKFPKGKVADSHWAWAGTSSAPELSLGEAKIKELLDAFRALAAGDEDFCVVAEGARRHERDESKLAIWFWQLPRAARQTN